MNRNIWSIIIFVIIAAAVIGGAVYYTRSLSNANNTAAANSGNQTNNQTANGMTIYQSEADLAAAASTTPSVSYSLSDGLNIADIQVGTGAAAKSGDTVTVNYIGTLANGKKFDASFDHGTTGFSFPLGQQQVIKGWDEGVAGMQVGGIRKLVIPPSLGYGSQDVGNGLIPANSTLSFTIQLVRIGS